MSGVRKYHVTIENIKADVTLCRKNYVLRNGIRLRWPIWRSAENAKSGGLFLKTNHDGLCIECNRALWQEVKQAMQREESKCEPETSSLPQRISDALKKELALDDRGEHILGEVQNYACSDLFSEDVNESLSLLAYRSLISGERPEALAKELLDLFPSLELDSVLSAMRTKRMIASSALVRQWALSMNLPWYIWRTARDGDRVRKSHQLMEGVICNWNDPPNPEKLLDGSIGQCLHLGYAQGCRCIALPVLSAEDVQLPARVHVRGEIKEISDMDELYSLIGY